MSLSSLMYFRQSRVFRANRADGLGDNHVDVSGLAVVNHTVKVLTFFCVGAGNTIIGVDNGKFRFVSPFSLPDPVLTQNPKKAGRSGRKQWKTRRANGGKKHTSEPKRFRFARETTYGPEGRGFESLTAYQKSSKSSDFEDFCFS